MWAISYAGPGGTPFIRLADVDGNSVLDLINVEEDAIHVYIGNGDGSFKAGVTYGGPPEGLEVRVGDFNEDGAADMVVGGETSPFVLLGNGDGTFKAGVSHTIGFTGNSCVTGDFNGDGHLDFGALGGLQLNLFLGNGDGTFKARRTYLAGGTQSPMVSDFNGDGFLDHVVGGTNVSLALGNGDGTFRAPRSYYSGPNPFNVRLADLNGDGMTDIVTANSGDSTASVLLNNGDGTFTAPTTYQNAARVQLADVNGDGVTDIVSTNNTGVGVFFGNTRTTPFVKSVDLTTQQGARSALSTLEQTHEKIVSALGNIGAHQERLGAVARNLVTARENFQAAESRIMDADIALETANNLRDSILQRTAAAVLSQANRAPEIALALLSG